MSRRVRIAASFILTLAAGVAANILVASSIVTWHADSWGDSFGGRLLPPAPRWMVRCLGGSIRGTSERWAGGVRITSCYAPRSDGTHPYLGEHEAGWPLRALEGRWMGDLNAPGWRGEPKLPDRGVLKLPVPGDAPRWVPRVLLLIPVWPGFLINSLLYAAVLWGGTVGARRGWVAARSRGRRRRGRCVGCGYAVGGLGVCPECGAASSPVAPP